MSGQEDDTEENCEYRYNEETEEWEYIGEDGNYVDPMDVEFRIFCNGFWGGFADRTTSTSGELSVGFFAELFEKTILKNFVFVDAIQDANVLFESVFAPSLVSYRDDWRYKIHFSGESVARTDLCFPNKSYYEDYDVVLCSHGAVRSNVIDLPLFVYYCYIGTRMERLQPHCRYYKHYLAEKFCCYAVSNGNVPYRDKILDVVDGYRRVDSVGRHRNSIGRVLPYSHSSEEFIGMISEYKFMICFENTIEGTYVTERLVNAFLGRTIPIYFGTNYVTHVFNKDAFLMLEDESEASYLRLLARIKELDDDDTKYIAMLNQPVFNPDFEYEKTYGMDALAQKIENVLQAPPDTYVGINDDVFPEDVENTYICLMPYRARHPQEFRRAEMKSTIANWQAYFKKHGKDVKIVVVEQDNDRPFNKGVLMNAAFLEAEKYYEVLEPRIYMHNNGDTIINMGEPFPRDLARPEVGFMDIRRTPHLEESFASNMLGGCCSFDVESYRRVNGFPNNLWGWGGDDWALMRRVREKRVAYHKSAAFNTNWMLEHRDHVRDMKASEQNIQLALTEPMEQSGLHNCGYNITRFGEFHVEEDGVIHLCIDIGA